MPRFFQVLPWCLLVLLIVAYLLARIFPASSIVFADPDRPALLGNDPWYHLHQTRASLENYPSLLRWDPGAFYPKGTKSDATGLFNLGTATVARLLGLKETDESGLIRLAAHIPVLLGALSVLFLFFLVREIAGVPTALLAVFFRLFLPGEELFRTLAGFSDQHAAEIALTTLLLWLTVRFARDESSNHLRRWGPLITGTSLAASIWLLLGTWFGALLTIAVLYSCFWIAVLASRKGGETLHRVRAFATPFAGAFLLYLISTLVFPDLVMKQSTFVPTLLVLAAQPCLCLLFPAVFPGLERRFGSKESVAGLVGVAALAGGILLLGSPDLRRLASLLFDENQSLISEQAPVDLPMLFHFYGLLFPFLAVGFWIGFRNREAFRFGFPTAFMILWCLLWKLTSDLGYVATALLPGFMALGVGTVLSGAKKSPRQKVLLRGIAAVCLVGTVISMAAGGTTQRPFLSPEQVAGMKIANRPWMDATDWLRSCTPEPSIRPTFPAEPWKRRKGFPYPEDVYGIMAPWQMGNLITVKGDRFPVAARFPTGKFIQWFLAIGEEASLAELSRYRNVRYVALDATSVAEAFPGEVLQQGRSLESFQVAEKPAEIGSTEIQLLSYGKEFRSSIGAQLYLGDGPGLSRYRLVWESPTRSFLRYRALVDIEAVELRSTLIDTPELYEQVLPLTRRGAAWTEYDFLCYSGDIQATVKIFEVVPGCTLRIPATPEVSGTVDLQLTSGENGRSFRYQQSLQADSSGMIQFTVPYSTAGDVPGSLFEATGPYRVQLADGTALEITVPEEDIREGRTVFPVARRVTREKPANSGASQESSQ